MLRKPLVKSSRLISLCLCGGLWVNIALAEPEQSATPLPASAFSEPSPAAWQAFGVATVSAHVLPAHKDFAKRSQALAQSISSYCQDTANTQANNHLDTLKQHFSESAIAWQSIRGIHFGPVEIALRHSAIQFWPDKKNHVGKRLKTLLTALETAPMSQNEVAKLPVSVKGLPALERLIFQSDKLSASPQAQCRALLAISQNLSTTAHSLYQEWHETMLGQFKDPRQLDGYYEDEIDAATSLLKALVEPIEYNRDLKLKRPMGSSAKKAKPTRLELWRSELALASLASNLESARHFYDLDGHEHSLKALLIASNRAQQASELSELFSRAQQSLKTIDAPLANTLNNSANYQRVEQHVKDLTALHHALETAVTELGIHLGFNSRDGD